MAPFCLKLLGPGPITHQGSRRAKLQQVAVLAASESKLAQRIASNSTRVYLHCTTAECFAEQAAGRTTIATFVYLVAMAVVTAFWPRSHFGYELQKLFAWMTLLIVSFLIPVPVSDYLLSWIGIVIAVLDLIAAVELISFACNLLPGRQSSPLGWALAIVATSATLAAAGYGCYQLSIGSCSAVYPIMIAIQMVIVVGAVVVARLVGSHSSLLTASVVTAYSTFVLYRAISYRTRPCSSEGALSDLIDAIGIAFNAVVIVHRAISTRPVSIFGSTAAHDPQDAVDLTLPTSIDANAKPLLLALAMLYLSVATGPSRSTPSTTAAFVFSVCTSLLISVLYIWTLIAPRLLPHRDFGIPAV